MYSQDTAESYLSLAETYVNLCALQTAQKCLDEAEHSLQCVSENRQGSVNDKLKRRCQIVKAQVELEKGNLTYWFVPWCVVTVM